MKNLLIVTLLAGVVVLAGCTKNTAETPEATDTVAPAAEQAAVDAAALLGVALAVAVVDAVDPQPANIVATIAEESNTQIILFFIPLIPPFA